MLKKNWRIIRTTLFIVIGLLNTVFISPDLKGTYQNYIGYALLVLAAVDIISMIISSFKKKAI